MPKPVLNFELRKQYESLFSTCVPRLPAMTTLAANKIKSNQLIYNNIGLAPWYVIGVIHELEGCSNFKTHLHNGDPLTAKTVHVPAGRPLNGTPPFTWEQSAKDALSMKMPYSDWSISGILYFLEGYNGFGYRSKGVNTPYLWGNSNHHTKGKYVSDGQYDPEAATSQIGAAVILKYMCNMEWIKLEKYEDLSKTMMLAPDNPNHPKNSFFGFWSKFFKKN